MRTGAELEVLAGVAARAQEAALRLDAEAEGVRQALAALGAAAGPGRPRQACRDAERALPRLLRTAARVGGTLADGARHQHALLDRAGR